MRLGGAARGVGADCGAAVRSWGSSTLVLFKGDGDAADDAPLAPPGVNVLGSHEQGAAQRVDLLGSESVTPSMTRRGLPDGAAQAGVAVDDAEQRGLQPPRAEAVQAPLHASYDSPPRSSNSTSTFWPSARTPTTAKTGTLTTLPPLRTRSARASR